MATYNPSKIIKDGNTYNFTDATKIPLTGTNALAGNIIPSVDATYSLGSSIYNFLYVNTKKIRQNNSSDNLSLIGAPGWNEGASLSLFGKNNTTLGGGFRIDAHNGTVFTRLEGAPNGTLTWGNKNVAMQEDVVPRSGGAVITGNFLGRNVNNDILELYGGTNNNDGAAVVLISSSFGWVEARGAVILTPKLSETNYKQMYIYPSGTWTWTGTAVQLVSDQRYKQQISEIDDKLLDAWEDVNLVQFKYNDAVDQKGKDKARLHTGYVVQQIDEACKSHNVDISEYGLYCHEVYQEETREVEHEDGTKTIEVVRPASEHYSLRYTEALIVECAYLRKKLKELTARIEELESSK